MPGGKGFAPGAGKNEAGAPPPGEAGRAVPVRNDAEAWGDLPTRVRDRFRNQGGEEFPTRYREWIDAYYRKLNER